VNPARFLLIIAAVSGLAGCATTPKFAEPNDQWESFHGQLQYITAGRSVVGEFVASRQGQDFRLDFTKGGAVSLIKVSRSAAAVRAEGPMAWGRWQGKVEAAPERLRGWVVDVPRAFAGIGSILKAARTAGGSRAQIDRNRPRRMEINGTPPGEKFIFVFAR
jgi:hypothetical protein